MTKPKRDTAAMRQHVRDLRARLSIDPGALMADLQATHGVRSVGTRAGSPAGVQSLTFEFASEEDARTAATALIGKGVPALSVGVYAVVVYHSTPAGEVTATE